MRLINEKNEQLGVVTLQKALEMAKESGLDLALVSPFVKPPVARILDYGKYLYRQKKQQQSQKSSQFKSEIKGIRLSVRTGDHDLQVKIRQAQKFLEKRFLVKITLIFRGREKSHIGLAKEKIDKIISALADISIIDQTPKYQGYQMIAIISPLLGKGKVKPTVSDVKIKEDIKIKELDEVKEKKSLPTVEE